MFTVNSSCSAINFQGLFKPDKVVKKMKGAPNRDKVQFVVHQFTYFPFEGESAELIEKNINDNCAGKKFSLWENDHGHVEGRYYLMNDIVLGSNIKLSDKGNFLKEGYMEQPTSAIISEDAFQAAYHNEAYNAFDEKILEINEIKEIISEENIYSEKTDSQI